MENVSLFSPQSNIHQSGNILWRYVSVGDVVHFNVDPFQTAFFAEAAHELDLVAGTAFLDLFLKYMHQIWCAFDMAGTAHTNFDLTRHIIHLLPSVSLDNFQSLFFIGAGKIFLLHNIILP